MSRVPLQDAEARRRASRATGNVAVTAGAGTGKTTLLIETVLAKLLVGGLDVRRILMLTFTEKAANEMRVRLGRDLRWLLDPPDPDWKDRRASWEREGADVEERLREAIRGLDRAEIGTIHSFCAHILREHPIEAGVDPAFEVDEGPRFESMFDREWERWLERELRADSPRRDEWLRVFERVGLPELRKAAHGLASFKVPAEILEAGRAGGGARLERDRLSMAERLDAILPSCTRPSNKLAPQLRDLAAYLRDPDPGRAGVLDRKGSEDTQGWADYDAAAALSGEARRLAGFVRAVDDDLVGAGVDLLSGFALDFRRAYTAEGFVSFDGLLAQVRTALLSTEFPEIRERLKARYDFILVDEFQDTDPAQGEVLLLLAEQGRAATARDVALKPGKLFIVGDPKQSIYSFRGADIVAYEEVKRRIVAQDGREEVLRTNFRSHSGIIGAVNSIFRRVLKPVEGLQPPYEEILAEAGRDPAGAAQRIELALFRSDEGKITSEESRRAEALWIARRLRRDVGTLEMPRGRTLAYGDVAILFKALTDVHLYLEALRAEGIPYVVEGEKYFYGTSEVIGVANLLRAAADPHDRIAVAGLLRSPLGGLDDRRLFERRGRLDYRIARKDEPGLFKTLRELHALAGTVPVPRFVDLAYEKTFALEVAAASWQGEQAVANLLKVRQTAQALDAQGGLTLRQFLARIKESIREMEEEGESPLADETLDAVRIMSIHKSKGLEFPVVLLPDLHRTVSRREDDVAIRFDWPTYTLGVRLGDWTDSGAAALAHQEEKRRVEEFRRVLYVALTRAKETLLMTGSAAYAPASYLGLLHEAAPALTDHPGVFRIDETEIHIHHELATEERIGPVPRERKKGGRRDWKKLAAKWKSRRKEAERVLSEPRFTSPSRLQEKRQTVATRDDLVRMERGAAVGTLCHRVLEAMDFRKPDPGPLLDRFADDPAVAEEARGVIEGFLKTPAFRAVAASEVLARELPFLMKDGDAILQGAIDLVVKERGKVVVVDWKSDRGGASEEKKERYAAQRSWYLKALKQILGAKKAAFRLVFLRTGATMEW